MSGRNGFFTRRSIGSTRGRNKSNDGVRRLGIVRLDAIKLHALNAGGNSLELLAQPDQFTPLLDDNFVQLIVLSFEVRDMRFEPFQIL